MGNRAFIRQAGRKMGVYLHWNGGRDSVEAFLEYCKLHGYRDFDSDDGYGIARFSQVVGNFFGGSLSVGVFDEIEDSEAEWLDNGIYEVKGWDIVKRIPEDILEQHSYKKVDVMLDIDASMPEKEQLGAEFICADVKKVGELKVGDVVWAKGSPEEYGKFTVVGFGKGIVNGQKVDGVPIVDKYERDGGYVWNINNYLLEKEYRVCKNKEGENGKNDTERKD